MGIFYLTLYNRRHITEPESNLLLVVIR